jgi:hypothetical protein
MPRGGHASPWLNQKVLVEPLETPPAKTQASNQESLRVFKKPVRSGTNP